MGDEPDFDSGTEGITELRVHGVSGTPPHALLGHPEAMVRRVRGDDRSGFYRRWFPGGTSDDLTGTHRLEAYSWGRLTSGPATRALWVLLLPFTLVNLAHWMLPPGRSGLRLASTAVTVLRLLALSLTLTLLLSVTTVTMDVAAWQCAGVDLCAPRLGPARSAAEWSVGARLVLGAALPVLLIALLWWLGKDDLRPGTKPPAPAVRAGANPLAAEAFWAGDKSVARQRAVHVTAWTASLAALLLAAPVRYGRSWEGPARAVLVLDLLVLAISVVLTASNGATGRGGEGAGWLNRPVALLRIAALVLLLASAGLAIVVDGDYPATVTHLPAMRGAIYGLLTAQFVLVLVLFVAVGLTVGRPVRRDPFAPAMYGLAAPTAAAAAWLLAGGFSVGLGLWAANYLGRPVAATAVAREELDAQRAVIADTGAALPDRLSALHGDIPLILPPPYFWVGTASIAIVLFLAVVGVVLRAAFVRARKRLLETVGGEYPGEDDADRARAVARLRALTGLTDAAHLIVFWFVMSVMALVLALAYVYGRGGYGLVQKQWPGLTTLGATLIALFVAALVGLAVRGFRSQSLRRRVGILWDVATFWPRANHPLTPPCYAERAVPELSDRIRELSAGTGDRVILSAHSQGSVVAAAAVLRLAAADGPRVDLVTYGSPLRRLIARFFPAYFNRASVAEVHTGVRVWTNLWAPSDPIGSWVFEPSGRVDRQLRDPRSLVAAAEGYPPTVGHSGFLQRPEYEELIAGYVAAASAAEDGGQDGPDGVGGG